MHDDAETQLRRTIEGLVGVPATDGNQIDVLRNGVEVFPAMLEAIDGAQRTIDFLTFVYWKGRVGTEFAEHLSARARAGVRVRVLLDAFGCKPLDRALVTMMDEAGVHIRWFRPLHRLKPGSYNHRTHRKVCIVDEGTGFTGGIGIADEWDGDARNENEWRDTHFRIRGPAVDGLRAAFLDNWVETDPELYDPEYDHFPVQPNPGSTTAMCVRGASETGWSDIATLFRALLQSAEKSVRLTTAYFVPEPELMAQLCDAGDRGIDVQVLLPGPHADKRFVRLAGQSSYAQLLGHGITIWCFQPTMLHAKVLTVDGVAACIGSANFNCRSSSLDEEINVVAFDADLVEVLDRQFDEDLERSVLLDETRWEHRPLRHRAAEALMRPLRRNF
jgi:cardiolipin synthase